MKNKMTTMMTTTEGQEPNFGCWTDDDLDQSDEIETLL